MVLEDLMHMALVGKTGGCGCGSAFRIRPQHAAQQAQAAKKLKGMRRHAGKLLKGPQEMPLAVSGVFSHLPDGSKLVRIFQYNRNHSLNRYIKKGVTFIQ